MIGTTLALGFHHRLKARKIDCLFDNVTYQLKFIAFVAWIIQAIQDIAILI